MKKLIRFSCYLLIIGLFIPGLIGCKDINAPPDIAAVQKHYQKHSEDIQIIIAFLSSSEYEDIYITDSSGIMLADLTKVPIEDQRVVKSIGRIINDGAYQHINKDGNNISLLQWKGIRDIGCGIACTISGTNTPEIEFVTQMIPLSDAGWFYYVSDYVVWQSNHKQAA